MNYQGLLDAADAYRARLLEEERGCATVEKYVRDIRTFLRFLPPRADWGREEVLEYKKLLGQSYRVSSANSMLVALNGFLTFLGRGECRVRLFRTQRRVMRSAGRELCREEYLRLLDAARRCGQQRLRLLMLTLCGTGIRISEHRFITVEAARAGRAEIAGKGKVRVVLLPKKLRRMLLDYCRERGIRSGCIFITRRGKPVDRSAVWAAMKRLCAEADVSPEKVFPHNLRHLFAVTFYSQQRDIVRLADLLGHSSVETTRIYTATSGAEHERQLERMRLIL